MGALRGGARPGRDRRRRPPGRLRLLVPRRRPGPGLRARYGGVRARVGAVPRPGPPSPTASRSAPTGRVASPSLGRGDDFARRFGAGEDTRHADVRLAASRAFLRAGPPGGLTPAATAAHLRDHGRGPWGAPGARAGLVRRSLRRRASERTSSGVTVCMHVRDRVVTAASMIAELPPGAGRDAPLRAWVAAGSPCVSVYVPCFPRAAAGPSPFVPLELSGEELWHAADRLRRRVEADPGALRRGPRRARPGGGRAVVRGGRGGGPAGPLGADRRHAGACVPWTPCARRSERAAQSPVQRGDAQRTLRRRIPCSAGVRRYAAPRPHSYSPRRDSQ